MPYIGYCWNNVSINWFKLDMLRFILCFLFTFTAWVLEILKLHAQLALFFHWAGLVQTPVGHCKDFAFYGLSWEAITVLGKERHELTCFKRITLVTFLEQTNVWKGQMTKAGRLGRRLLMSKTYVV